MLTVTIQKIEWDKAWAKARNALQVKDVQAKHDFGKESHTVVDRMTRAAQEILEQTRRGFEDG